VDAPGPEEARALIAGDPHCVRGMVSETTVREWMPVFGVLA
jgi:uncharacterized protein YciI